MENKEDEPDAVKNLFDDVTIAVTNTDQVDAYKTLTSNESGYESESEHNNIFDVIDALADEEDNLDYDDLIIYEISEELNLQDYEEDDLYDGIWLDMEKVNSHLSNNIQDDGNNQIKKSVECDGEKMVKNNHHKSHQRKQLGEGTFGKVYLGLKDSKLVAVKVPHEDQDNPLYERIYKDIIKHEIEVLKMLKHEKIISIEDYNTNEDSLPWFSMEFCGENSSLRNYIDLNHQTNPLSIKSIKNITKQVLQAIAFMHEKQTIHCDLKSDNILLYKSELIKLIDFGSTKTFQTNVDLEEQIYTTEYTKAPELIRSKNGTLKYNSKIDIWSIGCIIIEMHNGTRSASVGGRRAPKYPDEISDDERDFLNHCLDINPETRYTAEQLLAHKFINND